MHTYKCEKPSLVFFLHGLYPPVELYVKGYKYVFLSPLYLNKCKTDRWSVRADNFKKAWKILSITLSAMIVITVVLKEIQIERVNKLYWSRKMLTKLFVSGLLLKASLYVKVISLLLKECCRVTTNTFILHLFSAVCSSLNTRHLKKYLS